MFRKRLARRLSSAFLAFFLLLSTLFIGASPALAAFGTGTALFENTATFNDDWGVGLHGVANPVGVQATFTATSSTITVPSADTDGCVDLSICPTGEVTELNAHMHVKGYCASAGVRDSRFENEPEFLVFQVQDRCTNGYTNPVRYTAFITDTVWRGKYVTSVSRPVYHDVTWTGQTGTYSEPVIKARMFRDTGNTTCVDTQLYNNSTSTWDQIDQRCGAFNISGATNFPDQSYFWYGMYYGGNSHWNTSGDLGPEAALYVSDMQVQASTGGSWASLSGRQWINDSYMHNFYTSPTFYDMPYETGTFKFEWSEGGALAGTGTSAAASQMATCYAPQTTFCDYSQNRLPNDKAWAAYKAAPTMFGYNDTLLPRNLSIQRASPDNSIVTGNNVKLKSARSYYVRANCYASCSDLEVDLTGLGFGSGNYTVSSQGYVLRNGGGGTAPTCVWVTANVRYKCTLAAGSEVLQVWIKIKTVTTAVNINSLRVDAWFDGATVNRQQDVFIGP